MRWPQAEQWTRRDPSAGAPPVLYAALTILCVMTAYLVVTSPIARIAPLLVGGLALTIWLMVPEVAIYALVVLYPFSLTFHMGELRNLRPHDALIIALGVSLIGSLLAGSRRLQRFDGRLERFLLIVWGFLLLWGTLSYLMGPSNQWLLKDPVRNTWYVYRQVWRILLPFPLLTLCIKDRAMARRLIDLTLLVSVACALYALAGSMMSHRSAHGHFDSKNELAMFLVVVIPLALAQALVANDWRRRVIYALATLIMMRVLLLSQSRGGYVAFFASLLPLALFVPRRRLVAASTAGIIALVLVGLLGGDLLDRPNVKRILALQKPNEIHTMQWRQEQWAHFKDGVKERPLLGTGSGEDKSLLSTGRLGTAHNAFLSIAYRSGLPAAAAWFIFLGTVGLLSWRRTYLSVEVRERAFWLGLLGSLTALLTHGMVESALDGLRVQQFIWTLTAVALIELRARRSVPSAAPSPLFNAP